MQELPEYEFGPNENAFQPDVRIGQQWMKFVLTAGLPASHWSFGFLKTLIVI